MTTQTLAIDGDKVPTMGRFTVTTGGNDGPPWFATDDYRAAIDSAHGLHAIRVGNGATGGRVIVTRDGSPVWRIWDDGTAECL